MLNLIERKKDEGMSRTKIGAYLFAIGTLMTIGSKVLTGEIDMVTAFSQAWPYVSGLLVVVGFRDAM